MNLLFSNPALENRFRKMVHSTTNEIGGWLCIRCEPHTWPIKFSWRDTKAALMGREADRLLFIESVVMAPNESNIPANEWSAWDWQKAKEMAAETAKMHDAFLLHFHTHPNNNSKPSPQDLVFAGSLCKVWSQRAEFCIVTPDPLRLWGHSVKFGTPANPDAKPAYECGQFFSWRMKALKQFRRE